MNLTRLILSDLWFYRKPYLAILTGVMISTAVITGALIVGDSVRYSLQRLAGSRLGKIRYALSSDERFFRSELAGEISKQTQLRVAPAIQCAGIAINSDKNLRINQVRVVGADTRFFGFWNRPARALGEDEAIISRNVAEKLELRPGDELLLRIQKRGKAPANAPFSAEKTVSVPVRLKIVEIADDQQMGRFSLKSNQAAPFNVFISLGRMASALELPGYVNMLFAGGDESAVNSPGPDAALENCWTTDDAGLHFRMTPSERGDPASECEITTDRIFFDDSTAKSILSAIPGCESVLTYLVNNISSKSRSTPYSFVTAANEPFLRKPVGKRGIMINEWLAKDLGVGPGDPVYLRYFIMGPLQRLKDDSTCFVVKEILPDHGPLADPGLMPAFPGISEAGNCRDWETGTLVELKRIRDKDEQYWRDYRGTPKAFISLETGQKIWDNRFGHYTAFRFPTTGSNLKVIRKRLMEKIRPGQYRMSFRDIRQEGQIAAGNSTDFGQLFLSLSFFIVISAVLLTALLFSLLARTRMAETGILSATGFRKRLIIAIIAAEALLVSVAGSIAGTFAGLFYNELLVFGLNTLWYDAVNTSMIVMKVNPGALMTGALSGVVISAVVMVCVAWQNLRNPLAMLVKGATVSSGRVSAGKTRLLVAVAGFSFITIALVLILVMLIRGLTMNVPVFLTAGALLMLGGLIVMNEYLIRAMMKSTTTGFRGLVLKNLAMHRIRTMSVVTLLALGSFTIIITGANRRTFYGDETSRGSGTGGFLLWAETTLPVLNDLNTPDGARACGLQDEDLLKNVHYAQITRMDGDDASCLNLNQVSRPVLLGVPAGYFDRHKAFGFAELVPSVNPVHPWTSLDNRLGPDIIPGFADMTVITWGLGKKTGDTLLYRDESGKILKIRITGGLDNSIFQGNILVSDSLLRLFYPSAGGSRVMLIDGPAGNTDRIASLLETLFRDYGMMATPASARLAAFNAVENTYLSVFMLLGGLGLLIGTFGLGVVILQNIRQRKQEYAICLALGFTRRLILEMIIAEHLIMLLTALFLGLIAAFAGILPSLVSPEYTVPGLFIGGIILVVFLNGLLWIWIASSAAIKKDILKALRDE